MRPWTVYPTDSSHPNIKIDDAGGEILVIGGVHGDESCGWKSIQKFYRENYMNLSKSVTFVLANPIAAQAKQRYVDADLNRQFASQYTSDDNAYETRLADELQTLITNFNLVISLHSTQSTNEPFALFGSPITKTALESLHHISISKAIYTPKQNQRGSLIEYPNVIEIECGLQMSQDAVENAVAIISEAIAFIGGLHTQARTPKNDVQIFELQNPIPKPDGGVQLYIENLRTVKKDSLVAEIDGEYYYAPEDFAPILMSEGGYENIIGYRGQEVGWLSEGEYHTHPDRTDIITQIKF